MSKPIATAGDVEARPERKRVRCTKAQSPAVLNLDGALLHMQTMVQVSGQSLATLYRAAAESRLELIRVGKRCTRVRSEEARRYIASLGD